MVKRILILTLVLCVAGLSGAFAAGQKAPATAVEEPSETFEGLTEIDYSEWEIGKPGGNFILSFTNDPKTFNAITTAETSTSDIINRVFDAPVDRNNLTLEWEGELCEGWEIADDDLSAVFTMRSGLVWSDGAPLTAEDVVYTINDLIYNEEIQTNQKDGFYVGDELAIIELVDAMHFKVILPQVTAGLFNMMNIPVMPKHIIEPFIKENGAAAFNSYWGVDTDISTIVGCGPFLVGEYVPSQKIVLKKNPLYWKKDAAGQSLPYLDSITYVIVEDQNTSVLKFKAGEIHSYGLRGEDFADLVGMKDELNMDIYNGGPTAGTTFLVFNQNYTTVEEPKLTWFNDKRFRKAMGHLIDRETIINNVQFGFGYPQYSFIPSASPFFYDVEDIYPKFDPEAAKKILDEIGLKDRDGDGVREDEKGNRLSFVLQTNTSSTNRVQFGEIFTQEAKTIGVDITFKAGDFNTIVTALLNTYEWDAIIIGLTGGVDPYGSSNVYPSSGNLHMIEPLQESPRREWEAEIDKWWDHANLTLDDEQRKEGFMELQKIWADELPWIYTTLNLAMGAYSNELGNIKSRPVTRGLNGICEYLYFK